MTIETIKTLKKQTKRDSWMIQEKIRCSWKKIVCKTSMFDVIFFIVSHHSHKIYKYFVFFIENLRNNVMNFEEKKTIQNRFGKIEPNILGIACMSVSWQDFWKGCTVKVMDKKLNLHNCMPCSAIFFWHCLIY